MTIKEYLVGFNNYQLIRDPDKLIDSEVDSAQFAINETGGLNVKTVNGRAIMIFSVKGSKTKITLSVDKSPIKYWKKNKCGARPLKGLILKVNG